MPAEAPAQPTIESLQAELATLVARSFTLDQMLAESRQRETVLEYNLRMTQRLLALKEAQLKAAKPGEAPPAEKAKGRNRGLPTPHGNGATPAEPPQVKAA